MRTNFISIVFASAMAAACGNTQATQEGFTTEPAKYENKSHASDVTLLADYPQSGNATLTNAVCEYISEQLGGTYTGPLTSSDSIMAYYGNGQTTRLNELAKDMQGSAAAPLYYKQEIKVAAETDTYVTYTDFNEQFLGGAHGSHSMSGITFRKSDGRRFGYEMLRNTNTEDFRKLLKMGLKQYVESTGQKVNDDKQLAEVLFINNDVNYLPLPETPPYLTEKGMAFIYQPYEIAPYAVGSISFTIPYENLKPFLTETVNKLLATQGNAKQ